MHRSIAPALVRAALLSAALCALGAGAAVAATVSGTYTGKITQVDAPLAGQFAPNDAFTIHFSYDDTVADTDPGSSVIGSYPGAAIGTSGSIGSYSFSSGSGDIRVVNGLSGDSIGMFSATGAGVDVNGYALVIVQFTLDAFTPAPLSSDALPTSYLAASLFSQGRLRLSFLNPATSDTANVFGDISVAATPLPAALPLFIGALGGLGLAAWRRRCRS